MSAKTFVVTVAGAIGEAVVDREIVRAVAEGRVFVNGKRAAIDARVVPGDRVEVHEARAASNERATILARFGSILFADKPASLPTTADRRGSRSLESDIAKELGVASVHASSRIDVGVSGVVLCTLDREAHARVAALREDHLVERSYLAIANGKLEGDGEWSAPIGRVVRAGKSIPSTSGRDRESAVTRYRVLATTPRASLLRLAPITGRMHQLRVHASDAGLPLFGDKLHGGPPRFTDARGRVTTLDRIALHAVRCRLPGGVEGVATVPEALRALWIALDGDDDAWNGWDAR